MDEKYRLVFRGEVLDGQHRAVVKRRLMESLKLTEEQMEKLFSGSAVVLKKSVEAKVAARYQALFKQAGGRLRVHPVGETPPAATAAEQPPVSVKSASAPEPEPASTLSLVSQEEVDRSVAAAKAERTEITAPEFSLAELGEDLSEATEQIIAPIPEVDFTLADVGVVLGAENTTEDVVDVGELDFEVAAVGTTLVEPDQDPVPKAPDVSHLQLAEETQLQEMVTDSV